MNTQRKYSEFVILLNIFKLYNSSIKQVERCFNTLKYKYLNSKKQKIIQEISCKRTLKSNILEWK